MQRDLVVRAQRGDVAAFAELTAEKTGRLTAVARLILRDEDRTTDALQDALDEPREFGKYARMRRTTISLPDDLAAALEREARRRRVPVSQVAREAIEARLGLSGEGPREIPFIGAAESHDSTWSAADLDEFLAQTWANEIYRDAFNRDP